MSTFNISLESITHDTLKNLINVVPEGRQIDYKRELNFSTPEQKRELYKDVASLATASGGDIIYGLDENTDTTPSQIIPILLDDIDTLRLSIEQGIRSNIFPRINFQIQTISCDEGFIIIIRVLKNFHGPVALKDGDTYRFYSRNSTGKYPLDYLEVKNEFIQSSTLKEKFINFRNSRIDFFFSGNEGNNPAKPFLLFYIYPMNDYNIDLGSLDISNMILSIRPPAAGSYDYSFNIDGFKTFKKTAQGMKQTQLFRNGVVELFNDDFVIINEFGKKIFNIIIVEHMLLNAYKEILIFYKDKLISAPFILNLSLLNVNETRFSSDNIMHLGIDYIENHRPNLILPEIIVESEEMLNIKAMKPIFDDLWRAFGLQKALSYNGNSRKIGM